MVWILIGYLFLYIHRPLEVWPALAVLSWERYYIFFAIAVWAATAEKRWLSNPLHRAFFMLGGAVLVCCFASPWASYSLLQMEEYYKIFVFYILIVTVIHDERTLRQFCLGFLGVMTLYMLHSLWEFHNGRHVFRMGIVRLVGVDVTMSDPNTFGATVVYAIPLVVPFWMDRSSRALRLFLICYIAISVVCVGLTGSRSSFVGLIVVAFLNVATNRAWRVRLGILLVLASPLLWLALPPSLQNRFETIIHPEVGPNNAKQSADGRLDGLLTGLTLWEKNPIVGVGPGAFGKAAGHGYQAHNLLGQTVGEMGVLGLLALLFILYCFTRNAVEMYRLYRRHDWEPDFSSNMVKAVTITVALLLVMGIGGHNLFRYTWMYFGAFEIIALHGARLRAAQASEIYQGEEEAYGDYDPGIPARAGGYPLAGGGNPDLHPV